jgi:WD40 repeat protein
VLHQVVFNPDGSRLLTRDVSGAIASWDAATVSPAFGPLSGQKCNLLSPDGTRRAVLGGDGKSITVWDAAGRQVFADRVAAGSLAPPLAFSPDGEYLALTHVETQTVTVKVYQLRAGGVARNSFRMDHGSGRILDVALGRGGTKMALCYLWYDQGGKKNHVVDVLDITLNKHLLVKDAGGASGNLLAFNPDAAYLAVAGTADVVIWDVATGILKTRLVYPRPQAVTFSPDGWRIALVSNGTQVVVCTALTGTAVTTYRGHTGTVGGLAFSPDGRRIASAGRSGAGGELKVWDATTGR